MAIKGTSIWQKGSTYIAGKAWLQQPQHSPTHFHMSKHTAIVKKVFSTCSTFIGFQLQVMFVHMSLTSVSTCILLATVNAFIRLKPTNCLLYESASAGLLYIPSPPSAHHCREEKATIQADNTAQAEVHKRPHTKKETGWLVITLRTPPLARFKVATELQFDEINKLQQSDEMNKPILDLVMPTSCHGL